jgi:pimeloyl-ACP methyl ester carboxylesterase
MRPLANPLGRVSRRFARFVCVAVGLAVVVLCGVARAADTTLHETVSLPECHSIGWVKSHLEPDALTRWDGTLDEATWGTPSPQQAVIRNWDWNVSDEDWRKLVAAHGEGKREDVTFDLWIPEEAEVVRGVVVMSGHGSGTPLFKNPGLRAIARELHLGVFMFLGNPLQRGFWPRDMLREKLVAFGERAGRPELANAPLFLYGHSNGTGFSALHAAACPERVWAWVSMRPGITFQVYQPGAAAVPGLVIFGEDDQFLTRPRVAENLAVVPAIRKRFQAAWNMAVEPKTGHGPGEKTWPLVFSFLRHTFAARVPTASDPRQGPVKLASVDLESGSLGRNWDPKEGGYQNLPIAPFAEFPGDHTTASWLINAAYAADWQAFQRNGEVVSTAASR